MQEGLIIYGCYGYTGRLISHHAVKSGLTPTVAGRDKTKVEQLAKELNLPCLVFGLEKEVEVTEHLRNFKVVLHCAGPFKFTSKVMMAACLKSKTHYLDITGEYQVFEDAFGLDAEAKKAGILLMPGVGFDVVPSDCLAAYLKEILPTADRLEMALWQKGGRLSHGTALTVSENLGEPCIVRRRGKLVSRPNGEITKLIKLKEGSRTAVAISWGDISTAYRSTSIPNITIYNFLPQRVIDSMKMSNYIGFIFRLRIVKNFLATRIKKRPAGPSDKERETASSAIWGEVGNSFGVSKRAWLELPEGYTLTALTAIKIAQEVLAKEPMHGTKTPSQLFGKDFILQFDKVSRKDLT